MNNIGLQLWQGGEPKNNLVDNQDFFLSKQIPFAVEMNDIHEQKPPNEMIKKYAYLCNIAIIFQYTVYHEAWPWCIQSNHMSIFF